MGRGGKKRRSSRKKKRKKKNNPRNSKRRRAEEPWQTSNGRNDTTTKRRERECRCTCRLVSFPWLLLSVCKTCGPSLMDAIRHESSASAPLLPLRDHVVQDGIRRHNRRTHRRLPPPSFGLRAAAATAIGSVAVLFCSLFLVLEEGQGANRVRMRARLRFPSQKHFFCRGIGQKIHYVGKLPKTGSCMGLGLGFRGGSTREMHARAVEVQKGRKLQSNAP